MLEIAKKEAMVTSRLHGGVAVGQRLSRACIDLLGVVTYRFRLFRRGISMMQVRGDISCLFRTISRSASVWFWRERREEGYSDRRFTWWPCVIDSCF